MSKGIGNRKPSWLLICVFTAQALSLLSGDTAIAATWTPADRAPQALADHLAAIKASRASFFYADCIVGDRVKAALIVRAGSLVGQHFLIGDRTADGSALLAEQGEFNIRNGVTMEWWSGKQAKQGESILGSLVRQPMRLMLATQTDLVFKLAPTVSCSKPAFNK